MSSTRAAQSNKEQGDKKTGTFLDVGATDQQAGDKR